MDEIKHNNKISDIIRFVEEYSDDLYSWAYYKTSNPQTAEDLVQETFLAAVASYDKFQGISSPKTWLLSILNNKIIDSYRSKFKNITISESDLNPEKDAGFLNKFFDEDGSWRPEYMPDNDIEFSGNLLDNTEFIKILKKCIDELPGLWNSAIQLKYLDGRHPKLICQELNIKPTNYWQILHRAKLKLRNCLNNNWFEKS